MSEEVINSGGTKMSELKIKHMSALELLDYVMENPSYIYESHYIRIGREIEDRLKELQEEEIN